MKKIKSIVKEWCPPIFLRYAKRFIFPVGSEYVERGKERDPDWYDNNFLLKDHYREHYTQSGYYFLWSVIADRIVREGINSIFEIGCGPGQLGLLLHDRGIENYTGFDFSPKRIEWARMKCPEFTFHVADALTTDLYRRVSYDVVVCTEFFEHIEKDIEVLSCIRRGARVYASVPNRASASHVRYFNNVAEVYARYSGCFESFRVDELLADPQKKSIYFLMEGIKR